MTVPIHTVHCHMSPTTVSQIFRSESETVTRFRPPLHDPPRFGNKSDWCNQPHPIRNTIRNKSDWCLHPIRNKSATVSILFLIHRCCMQPCLHVTLLPIGSSSEFKNPSSPPSNSFIPTLEFIQHLSCLLLLMLIQFHLLSNLCFSLLFHVLVTSLGIVVVIPLLIVALLLHFYNLKIALTIV